LKKIFLQKLLKCGPPIITEGGNPDHWDYQGLPHGLRAGEAGSRWQIVLEKNPITNIETVRLERREEWEDDVDEYKFYSITGTNTQGIERLLEGDVPGIFWCTIMIPQGGTFEFKILEKEMEDRPIGPEATTTKRTAPIVGPKAGLDQVWQIKEKPETEWIIEFFAPPHGPRSISWRRVSGENARFE